MTFLLILLGSYLLLCYGLSLVFSKATQGGQTLQIAPNDAWIPGKNFAQWCKLIGRKPTFALWLLVPIVNVFIYASMCVDLARSLGKFSFFDAFFSVVAAPIYFILQGRDESVSYNGPVLLQEAAYHAEVLKAEERGEKRKHTRLLAESPYKRSSGREWAEAIIFAVSAAWLIRLFIFEMFVIPTSSMEGSMLVGDYLLVSKAHYGIRTPKTIAMVPLLHNRLPGDLGESYLKWPQLEMHRLPAIESIDRNDPIVFNFPLGDSVYVLPGRNWSAEDYRVGSVRGDHARKIASGKVPLITRPLDKKDHYVKRAVAVAGDTVEIRNRALFLNGERAIDPPNIQFSYTVKNTGNVRLSAEVLDDLGITVEDLRTGTLRQAQSELDKGTFTAVLNEQQKDALKAMNPDIVFEPLIQYTDGRDTVGLSLNLNQQRNYELNKRALATRLFPHDPDNFANWTIDNYGPIYVPKAGTTVQIGPKNISLYRRIIEVYEGHKVTVGPSGVTIDGKNSKSYTFKQDYYWAMGDNRHGSEDSRFWGFVPADHIVGKPLFIWFSTKNGNMANGIRWNRIFKGATQME